MGEMLLVGHETKIIILLYSKIHYLLYKLYLLYIYFNFIETYLLNSKKTKKYFFFVVVKFKSFLQCSIRYFFQVICHKIIIQESYSNWQCLTVQTFPGWVDNWKIITGTSTNHQVKGPPLSNLHNREAPSGVNIIAWHIWSSTIYSSGIKHYHWCSHNKTTAFACFEHKRIRDGHFP